MSYPTSIISKEPQQWEYTRIKVQEAILNEQLAYFGINRWELVSMVMENPIVDSYTLVFKRPIPIYDERKKTSSYVKYVGFDAK
jgi:hypothetical protein